MYDSSINNVLLRADIDISRAMATIQQHAYAPAGAGDESSSVGSNASAAVAWVHHIYPFLA